MRFLRYCFSLYGRFSRTDFWIGYGIAFVAIMLPVMLFVGNPDNTLAFVLGIWCLAWLVSICVIATKRLHDLDHSGWLLLAFFGVLVAVAIAFRAHPEDQAYESLVPGIGLLYLGCARGVKGNNRFGPEPPAVSLLPPKQDQKLTCAYEMGQQSADAFAADLDKLMAVRFKTVHDNFVGVIQGQYNKCLNPTDAPPLTAARVEYKIFLDQVDELRRKMTDEIAVTLSAWLDLANEMQMRGTFMQLIQAKVDAFCRELSETGLQRLLDMAHKVQLADAQWRTAHPDLSAKFPPEA